MVQIVKGNELRLNVHTTSKEECLWRTLLTGNHGQEI